jgi:hypothetical protein
MEKLLKLAKVDHVPLFLAAFYRLRLYLCLTIWGLFQFDLAGSVILVVLELSLSTTELSTQSRLTQPMEISHCSLETGTRTTTQCRIIAGCFTWVFQ